MDMDQELDNRKFQTRKERKLQKNREKEEVRFLYITEVASKNAKIYQKYGRLNRRRKYCFGVLTTLNKFYFIEYKMLTCFLSAKQIKKLKNTILNRFSFTIDTQVVFDDKIEPNDIMWCLFQILQISTLFTLNRISQSKMYSATNQYFNLGFKGKKEFGEKRKVVAFENARNGGLLDFIPNEYFDMLEIRMHRNRERLMDTMMSMLYMWKKEEFRKWNIAHQAKMVE